MVFNSLLRRNKASHVRAVIAEADQARDQGDWARARHLYRTALDQEPDRAGVWTQYGHALKETGFLHEAEQAYQTAIDGRPDRADTHVQMGHLKRLLGRPDEAAESYVRAVELDPTYRPALQELRHLRHAGCDIDVGRIEAAFASLIGSDAKNLDDFWLDGALEDITGHCISGWALDTRGGSSALQIELWINGQSRGRTTADRFRRDLQDRFGGSGLAGFSFNLSEPILEGSIEIRDVSGHRLLARAVQQKADAGIEAWRAIRRELSNLASQTAALEARLPDLERNLVFALEDYGDYFQALYRHPSSDMTPVQSPPVAVLLDGSEQHDRLIEDAVWSISDQTFTDWSLIIHGVAAEQFEFVTDLGHRLERRSRRAPKIVMKDVPLDTTIAEVTATWLVTLSAGGVLEPDALARLGRAFEDPEIEVAYPDEDHLDPDPGVCFRSARHESPRFKPDFDPDLLTQVPFVGCCVAFRTETARGVGFRDAAGELYAADALLRLDLPASRVAHVARILYSRRRDALLRADWAACLSHAFAGSLGVAVVPHEDVLGAAVEAVRIARHPGEATATIIVPTKDQPDLLKACINSILTLRPQWRTRTKVIVIDHDSQDPETAAYLSEIAASPDVQVMPFSGAFNWALMNNRAAELTTSDVLVFLNNDTEALSQDWLDEMVSQALRPDVGVVGARLVYGDRSIQHAGIVSRDRPEAFLAHEGVGSPGTDPGYLGRHALMRSVVAVTGAAMATRRDVFQNLGGFDAAHFPVEGNDVDFCMRAATAGLRVLYDPYAVLFHFESKSRGFSRSGRKQGIAAAAAHVLWSRWGARFGRDPGMNRHFDTRSRLFTRLTAPPD